VSVTTQMNIAANNQGDHCIFAFDQSTPPRLVDGPNLEFDTTFCRHVRGGTVGAATNPVLGTASLNSLNFVAAAEPPTGNGLVYATGFDQTLTDLNGFLRDQLASAIEIKAASRALLVNEADRLETRSNTRADLLAATKMRLDAVAVIPFTQRSANSTLTLARI